MSDDKITITLERDDWVTIGKQMTKDVGNMVDIMPAARLIESLMQNGIKTSELDPKGGR